MLIKAPVQSGWIKGIRLTLARPYLNSEHGLLSPEPQTPITTHRSVAAARGGSGGRAAPRTPRPAHTPNRACRGSPPPRHLRATATASPGAPGSPDGLAARCVVPPSGGPGGPAATGLARRGRGYPPPPPRAPPAPPPGPARRGVRGPAAAGWARPARRLHPRCAPRDWRRERVSPPRSQ